MLASVRVVSGGEVVVVAGETFRIENRRIRLRNPDKAVDFFYTFTSAKLAPASANPLLQTAIPIHSQTTLVQGTLAASEELLGFSVRNLNITTLFGEGFAPDGFSVVAGSADLDNGRLPARLGGVCGEIDGARAPLFFVSSNQINLQALDQASGAVSAVVVRACDTTEESRSAPETTSTAPRSPAWFLSLIPRLYDPTSGAVEIDGVDIRKYQIESLRSRIAVVPQEAGLFNTSIADNIALGAEHRREGDIRRAARLAPATELIERLLDAGVTRSAGTANGSTRPFASV